MSCIVCDHPQRDAIDAALKAGASIRSVVKRFGTSVARTHHHQKEHLRAVAQVTEEIRAAQATTIEAVPIGAPDEIEGWIRKACTHALAVLTRCTGARDVAVILNSLVPASKLLGELTGRLGAAVADREWERMSPAELDAEALKVLDRHPEVLARLMATAKP